MVPSPDVITVPEEQYKFGEHVLLIDRRPIPITADHFWSAYDDYLTFQKSLNLHEDTRLEPGPKNGPGATISFQYRGSRTYETLLIKDDEKKVWKIHLPKANAVFSFYEATIELFEGEEGCQDEARATLDGIFIEEDNKERRALIDSIADVWVTRIRELVAFVLERDGLRQKHEFTIKCPLDDLWKVVGTWSDVSWVVGATGVKIHEGVLKARTVMLENGGEVFEYERENSDKEHKLVYVVERSTGSNPLEAYKGTLQLEPHCSDPESVSVKYDLVFTPKKGVDSKAAMEAVDKDMKRRFEFLKAKFAK